MYLSALGNLQRFGPCDLEETKYEIYSDQINFQFNDMLGTATYNVSFFNLSWQSLRPALKKDGDLWPSSKNKLKNKY